MERYREGEREDEGERRLIRHREYREGDRQRQSERNRERERTDGGRKKKK